LGLLISIAAIGKEPNGQEIELRLDQAEQTAQPEASPPAEECPPAAVPNAAFGKGPDIKAPSAILVDASTGQILYSRKPHYRRPIASTTKIMTALLVLEHCKLDGIVTASKNASKVPYSSLHLLPGERLSVRDMLTAMMLRSANDAAYAFAEHIAGSPSRFSRLMNRKARALGMKDTHFKNPNGLYVPGHYSTAYDLAILARAAIKHPVFNEIVAMRSAVINRSKNKKDLLMFTRSPFMREYPGADGIKSGYTKEAGHCYVGSATRGGWRLISVVLKSDNASRDSMALMDYGFANFQQVELASKENRYPVRVIGGKKSHVYAAPSDQIAVVVAKGQSRDAAVKMTMDEVKAPVKAGQTVGRVTAYVGGMPVRSAALVATESVDRTLFLSVWLPVRWPVIGSAAPLAVFGIRRIKRGRSPAKNIIRRRRGFSSARGRFDPRG